jgi:hypothetical protein
MGSKAVSKGFKDPSFKLAHSLELLALENLKSNLCADENYSGGEL